MAEGPSRSDEAHDAAHQASTTIEVGDDTGSESGFSDIASSADSTSLSSSVRDYAFENGRRYHKYQEGRYNFPNDDEEQDREDMKHALVVTTMGDKLHYAPIGDHPQQILDLGTGTGIWAVEVGEQYPSASVQGLDLSPIQPNWVPPNVRFLVDDAEAPWVHPENHFDLIHARNMATAFKNWPNLLKQAYRHTKPGGWVELQDFDYICHFDDDSSPKPYYFGEMMDNVQEGLKNLGVDLRGNVQRFRNDLAEAGFVNIEERISKVPIGSWAKNKLLKKVGLYMQANCLDGCQAIALGPLCRGLGWPQDRVEVFLKGVRDHLKDSKIHSYMKFHVFYAQKPGGGQG